MRINVYHRSPWEKEKGRARPCEKGVEGPSGSDRKATAQGVDITVRGTPRMVYYGPDQARVVNKEALKGFGNEAVV